MAPASGSISRDGCARCAPPLPAAVKGNVMNLHCSRPSATRGAHAMLHMEAAATHPGCSAALPPPLVAERSVRL